MVSMIIIELKLYYLHTVKCFQVLLFRIINFLYKLSPSNPIMIICLYNSLMVLNIAIYCLQIVLILANIAI